MSRRFGLFLGAALLALASGTPADAAYLFKQHSACSGPSGCTTTAADFTGVDLIVVAIANYSGSSGYTLTDSSGNSYTVGETAGNCNTGLYMLYVQAPTVSSSMTFTVSSSSPSLLVLGFSGSASSPLDQTAANGSGCSTVTSLMANSITPGSNGELIVTVLGRSDAAISGENINDSFTLVDNIEWASSASEGLTNAYLVQATAAAIAPTWGWTGSVAAVTEVLSFKAGGGGPPASPPMRSMMGVGQ
jgi:hypothetical protein